MDRFLARQPILTADKSVFAYEILSRFGPENYCHPPADGVGTVNAVDALFLMGLKQMTSGLPAFVNCNREFLVRDYLELLPREHVVGEILETVAPDKEVLAACRRMREKGYRLALDDYEGGPHMHPFFELVDFVKVDVLLTSQAEQKRLARELGRLRIPLIAEKVETQDQFSANVAMGYRYFQGYFFCRPETVTRREVPPNRTTYLRIMQALSAPHFEIDEISDLIKQEVSLSYRLLRYLNSPIFPVSGEVQSIPHALSLLGERMSRKWLGVVCMASMAGGKPSELVKTSLVRARFCELLAEPLRIPAEANELFLMGLLSVMDALLDLPMQDVLAKLPLDARIKSALNLESGDFLPLLELVLHYEAGNWKELSARARSLKLDEGEVSALYLNALNWADEIWGATPAAPVEASR